ncbi:MAG: nucleotide exchange factor GrpE [Oscillospiraceae bacterium]|nr:nucleotide exchange factor GrpE [Oscillospiraceae bacterium]
MSDNIEQEIEQEEEIVLDPVVEELKSTKDQLLRLAAEFDNYKKRTARDTEQARQNARADLFGQLLPLMDNFTRAAEAACTDDCLDDYKQGVQMIFDQFVAMFAANEVAAFGEVGEEFDPNCHNAVMHVEDENFGANTIMAVHSKGYRMKDRIIREAMVGVAN